MASGNALASYNGAGGMLQMMQRSESSSTDTIVALLSSRAGPGAGVGTGAGAGAGHSPGKGGLEEGVLPHPSSNASPSASNLKRPFSYPTLFETSPEETGDEDGGDDLGQPAEKKRRLTAEQVRSLEKNFEMENKLEPERKMQLARDLGLQPRQVAVWFQNRRARWKTKQLEKDYEMLKADYDALKGDYNTLLEEKERLVQEVKRLSLDKSPARDEQLPECSNSSSEPGKPNKVSDPNVSPSKAVAPTDGVQAAATKIVPAAAVVAASAKSALIMSELLSVPTNDLSASDFQLSPKSVTNFPSSNNNSQDSRSTLRYGACGRGSPHSSDTCNSVNSGMSNVDSPHQAVDSDYGKLLPILQQNSPAAASTDISGPALNWSSGSCASTVTSCGFMASPTEVSPCSSLPPALITDIPFPSSMLAAMEPFQHLGDDFDSPRLMNPGLSYASQPRPEVKLEDGACQQSDELSSYFFSVDDKNSVPWWDWP